MHLAFWDKSVAADFKTIKRFIEKVLSSINDSKCTVWYIRQIS